MNTPALDHVLLRRQAILDTDSELVGYSLAFANGAGTELPTSTRVAALVCAAVGCPALRNEAYTAEKLDAQLEQALVLFLSDRTRNRYDGKTRTFHVSPLFQWYGDDFKEKYGSLGKFFMAYAHAFSLNDQERTALKKEGATIVFGNYDWALNDR